MILNVKKLYPGAQLPTQASPGSACFDLYANNWSCTDGYDSYGTGIAVSFEHDFVGLIFPRSSISNTGASLANSVGVLDADYRGEIKLRMYRGNAMPYVNGDRVGQILFVRKEEIEINETNELDWTVRGTGGFGSTGK